jgi:hypothetical protein
LSSSDLHLGVAVKGDELSLRLRPWDLFVEVALHEPAVELRQVLQERLAFDREHCDERDDPSDRGRILEHERIPAGEEGVTENARSDNGAVRHPRSRACNGSLALSSRPARS